MTRRTDISLADLYHRPHTVSHAPGGAWEEWRMCCPIHGGNNPTSFKINLLNGLYHCFACQAGGRLSEYQHIPFSLVATAPDVTKLVHSTSGSFAQRICTLPNDIDLKRQQMKATQRILASSGKQMEPGRAYLAVRGIRLETALALGVGFAPSFRFSIGNDVVTRPALLFPLYRPYLGFVNFYARSLPSLLTETTGASVRAATVPGERLHKVATGSKGIFNLAVLAQPSQSQQPLVLVEGVFDALAAIEAGYPAGRVAALIGTSLLNPLWYKDAGEVLLAFDHDEAGQLAQAKAYQQLSELGGVRCTTVPLGAWGNHKDFAAYWQATNNNSTQLQTNPTLKIEPGY